MFENVKDRAKRRFPLGGWFIATVIVATAYMQYLWGRDIKWDDPSIAPPSYRGAEAAPRVYSDDELMSMARKLQVDVHTQYRELAPKPGFKLSLGPRTKFLLGVRMQETFSGGLNVSLEASSYRSRKLVKEWIRDFENADNFHESEPDYTRTIADELVLLAGAR